MRLDEIGTTLLPQQLLAGQRDDGAIVVNANGVELQLLVARIESFAHLVVAAVESGQQLGQLELLGGGQVQRCGTAALRPQRASPQRVAAVTAVRRLNSHFRGRIQVALRLVARKMLPIDPYSACHAAKAHRLASR